jgi:hypothetical protein
MTSRRWLIGSAAWLAITALGNGCTNALLFYETGKIGLSLQARPNDASQPLQGSLAFKQRTAAIVPPKRTDADAGAMISSFRFGKEPGFFGPITIETGLITGDAAYQVSQNSVQATGAARALTAAPISTSDVNAQAMIRNAIQRQKLDRLKVLAAASWSSLTSAEQNEFCDITGIGRSNPQRELLHDTVRGQLAAQ